MSLDNVKHWESGVDFNFVPKLFSTSQQNRRGERPGHEVGADLIEILTMNLVVTKSHRDYPWLTVVTVAFSLFLTQISISGRKHGQFSANH